jgi:alpha-galactosidase
LHRLGLVRTTIKERIAMRNKLQANVQRAVNGHVPAEQLKRSRETAADIIDAHSNARTFIDVGNLPNIGQIANLPRGMVVETAVRVDANGFTPLSFGDLPTIVHNFVRPWADVFITVVDACFKKDEKLALQALRMDPVCSHLTTDHVNQMGLRLLRAHSKYITAF